MNPPTDTGINAIAFRVAGRVQGVSFRWFGKKSAEELGVSGWIRNRADGSVEGEAFGPAPALAKFHQRLRTGPAAAAVEGLDWDPIDAGDAPDGFAIRF